MRVRTRGDFSRSRKMTKHFPLDDNVSSASPNVPSIGNHFIKRLRVTESVPDDDGKDARWTLFTSPGSTKVGLSVLRLIL